MSTNASEPPLPPPLTYVELVRQNGGQHTVAMWLIMGEKCVLSTLGILFNAILVAATESSKHLRLIALDSAFFTLFQSNSLITFFLPTVFGTIFVPISLCFWLQAVPLFAVLMSFCLMFQIGLERLASVLFPVWSMKQNSKRFHQAFLFLSMVSNLFLMCLCYSAYHDINTMVICTLSDVTAMGLFYTISFNRSVILHILLIIIYIAIFMILKLKKEKQNYSKSIFRSLLLLVFFETVGWVPSIFFGQFIKFVQFSPVTATYTTMAFSIIAQCITASANGPTLYYFSRLYREEMNAFLASIGIKLYGNRRQKRNPISRNVVVVTMHNNWIH